jgi:hypothetical protein
MMDPVLIRGDDVALLERTMDLTATATRPDKDYDGLITSLMVRGRSS